VSTVSPFHLSDLLARALDARAELFDARHESARRLFNGFYEGEPHLAVDLYARTLLLHNYADPPALAQDLVNHALQFLRQRLPWLRAVVLKTRHAAAAADAVNVAPDDDGRRGVLLFGDMPDRKVREHGVWYALDLLMNRDASFYLDTRALRRWLIEHMAGKTVLNTFAYTGSLGVAALAGGAQRVVQLDRNRAFLNLAKTSYTLNGYPIHKPDFIAADFFTAVSHMKRVGESFDCVLIDPPFFSVTGKGRVDLEHESQRLINKVRPLVNDGGVLIAINNALFVSGADYLRTLQDLCADGYLSIEELIPVPPDFTGFPQTRVGQPPADPAPFNHPTKIAVLRVKRKGQSHI
jgi:23S rRNA (cytosine1962-C5)-methyltransferase